MKKLKPLKRISMAAITVALLTGTAFAATPDVPMEPLTPAHNFYQVLDKQVKTDFSQIEEGRKSFEVLTNRADATAANYQNALSADDAYAKAVDNDNQYGEALAADQAFEAAVQLREKYVVAKAIDDNSATAAGIPNDTTADAGGTAMHTNAQLAKVELDKAVVHGAVIDPDLQARIDAGTDVNATAAEVNDFVNAASSFLADEADKEDADALKTQVDALDIPSLEADANASDADALKVEADKTDADALKVEADKTDAAALQDVANAARATVDATDISQEGASAASANVNEQGRHLNDLTTVVKVHDKKIADNTRRIGDLENRADKADEGIKEAKQGVSMAMAMGAVPQAAVMGQTMVGAGAATFDGESGFSAGVSHAFDLGNDFGLTVSAKVAASSDIQAGAVGAAFSF